MLWPWCRPAAVTLIGPLAREPPHTKDLCIELLKQLNCEVTTSKENENRLYFEYQGEHIVIDASNDSYFIEMWDPWWCIIPLDDREQMSNVRKAINTINNYSGTTIVYCIEEEEQKFVLRYSFTQGNSFGNIQWHLE